MPRATARARGATPTGRRPGVLPRAADYKPARLIVFTGTTGAWKGIFSVHSWIVFKPAGATNWTRYDVVGWGRPVRANGWPADGRWYGNTPVAIADVSGDEATRLIPKVERAVHNYSYNRVRRLPDLAGAELKQLYRRRAARGAGTQSGAAGQRRSAATTAPAFTPAAPTAAPASNSTPMGWRP